MSRLRPRTRTATAAALLVVVGVLAALAGCSNAVGNQGPPDKGFLAGDGTIVKLDVAKRRSPVSFTGTTLQGKPFDVSSYRGKVVVVNVWGSWCGPCVQEAPALQQVWQEFTGREVQFVGINTRDQTDNARAHERRFGVSYPSIEDDQGRVLLALRGTLPPKAVPSTLVLDRQGRVAYRVLSAVRASTLRGLVEDTLAEKAPRSAQGHP
ncbi:MAG: TlpA family protein disulfide reductase [Actinomycetes bacterium]